MAVEAELKRHWAHALQQREQAAEELRGELDAVEAELFAYIRDQHNWPLTEEDPRKLKTQWREVAFQPDLAASMKQFQPETDPRDLTARRSAEAEELRTLALERELAEDLQRLEARREEERKQLREAFSPASLEAGEQELAEIEAELEADLAALNVTRGVQDDIWPGVDPLPQEASEAGDSVGLVSTPLASKSDAERLSQLTPLPSVAGVRPVSSVPLWAYRKPPVSTSQATATPS